MKNIHEPESGKRVKNSPPAGNEYGTRQYGQTGIRQISAEELRTRYADELRAMNHVPEELVDTSDLDTCSAMDCTGLMPTPPLSDAELESYDDLLHMYPKIPENKGKV